jgi:hypothetical protein
MSLGAKKTHTGVVRRQLVNKGSKSEHNAVVLDCGDGHPVPLRVKGGNPFHDPALDPFVGMRVTLEGVALSGVHAILVDNVSDITVLGPPGRPARPSGPKP